MHALILVDIQNDFLPGGALAVPGGDEIIPVVNALLPKHNLVVATQDWHPANHGSFASQHPGHAVGDVVKLGGLDQICWPDHCVQNTVGAQLASGLEQTAISEIFLKGTDPAIDSYSAFYDNAHRRATGLGDYLKARGVTDVVIVGLALDYCVKFTAQDALGLGLKTTVVTDATRAVNLDPTDGDRALEALRTTGAVITTSEPLLR